LILDVEEEHARGHADLGGREETIPRVLIAEPSVRSVVSGEDRRQRAPEAGLGGGEFGRPKASTRIRVEQLGQDLRVRHELRPYHAGATLVALVGSVTFGAACTRPASPNADGRLPAVARSLPAGAVSAGAAPAALPMPWSLGGRDELCVFAPGRRLHCASPALSPRNGSVAWNARAAAPAPDGLDVVEALSSTLLRTTAGVVRDHGAPVAHDIASLDGHPYLVSTNGAALVLDDGGDPGSREVRTIRADLVRGLPPVTRIETSGFHTCAQTRSGEVFCWIEPRFWFSDELEKPVAPKLVRLALPDRAADMIVQPWLSVCVRTVAGNVFCNATPPTERCDLSGSSTIRCGRPKSPEHGSPLAKGSYDPRAVFARPLVAFGVDEATSLVGFRRRLFSDHDVRSMVTTQFAEGGCARRRDGGVRCFVRDDCIPERPWRTFDVEGVPAEGTLTAGADDAYVVEDGIVTTWSRRSTCPDRVDRAQTKPKVFGAKVASIGGGTFIAENDTVFVGVDCAALATGELRCWRTDGAIGDDVSVRFEH
jgi:hypothetical protein